MRVCIAGSRNLTDVRLVERAVELSGYEVTCVISGTCRGVDRLGEAWAKARGVKIERYPADWEAYGKSAGPLRNSTMVNVSDAVIAILNNDQDRGTLDTIRKAMIGGVPVTVFEAKELLCDTK